MPISAETRRASILRRQVVRLVEQRIAALVRPYSLILLRMSLGVVFVWFGALKVAGATPVADLVAATVPWMDRTWFVPLLGVIEMLLGIALFAGRRLTLVGFALAVHLAGTFLVLLMQPQVAFQDGNPMLLTTVGEFVVKNLVLISAGIVVASRHHAQQPISRAAADTADTIGV
jgi:putative oxidoreductase